MNVSNRRRSSENTLGLVTHQAMKRARGVSMYVTPPSEELTIDEFEQFAVDRLVVLRMIENLRIKGFKPRELVQQLTPVLKKHGLSSSADELYRRKDTVSHFILRVAYSKSEDLRRWFLTQEVALFRLRLEALSNHEFELFVHQQGIRFEETTKDGSNSFYLIPFTEALDLVAKREAKLEAGKVLVPQHKLHSIVTARFRTQLSKSLTKASHFFPQVSSDPRLASLLKNVERHDAIAHDTDIAPTEHITADQLDALSKTSMPLCMRITHEAVRRDHKLKHWGRVQYGLFLKAAGLPMEEQLSFFQTEFTKIMTHEQFSKEYAYGIRHRYGQEGKRTDYTAYGCYKIIMDFAPGPGDFHGCPYRHYSKDHLAALFSQMHIAPTHQTELIGLAKSQNYQIACQRHFEITHPGALDHQDLALVGVGNHPNAYFKASRAYYKARATAKGEHLDSQIVPAADPQGHPQLFFSRPSNSI